MRAHDELTRLARPTTLDELAEARGSLQHYVAFVDAQRDEHEFIEVELARTITDVLVALLGEAETYTPDQRSLLRAAIDYFLLTDDADHDVTSPIGMEDDAAVINVVCEELGRSDLAIEVP